MPGLSRRVHQCGLRPVSVFVQQNLDPRNHILVLNIPTDLESMDPLEPSCRRLLCWDTLARCIFSSRGTLAEKSCPRWVSVVKVTFEH